MERWAKCWLLWESRLTPDRWPVSRLQGDRGWEPEADPGYDLDAHPPLLHLHASVGGRGRCGGTKHTYTHTYTHTYLHTYLHTYIHVARHRQTRVMNMNKSQTTDGQTVRLLDADREPSRQGMSTLIPKASILFVYSVTQYISIVVFIFFKCLQTHRFIYIGSDLADFYLWNARHRHRHRKRWVGRGEGARVRKHLAFDPRRVRPHDRRVESHS